MYRMDNYNSMKVIPVSFSLEHKQMLQQTKIILERGVVAINPKYDKLITALRTAVEQDGSLDKEATSHPDIMDAFRLSLKALTFREKGQMQKPRIWKVCLSNSVNTRQSI
ncbi:MAG TPA: hypothetical protein VE076_02820, partial [Nitrososphaeraceae archaeon]|nr:hypothetical protein [Nitrososphaeraceae archaeon]